MAIWMRTESQELTTKHSALTYYPHVDGLRAVSILSVVAYHAGFAWLPGGFVGVDIFFVISGFLIISQIVSHIRAGTFSFAAFWSRRTVRILPPFFLVLGVGICIGFATLVLPTEFHEFGREVSTAALMISNFRFMRGGGYFAPEADTQPLLHTWSLGVEEQFYLIAPIFIFGVWWVLKLVTSPDKNPLLIGSLFTILFCASLWGCIYWTPVGFERNKAFYLMPFRAWEFAAGGAVAFLVPWFRRAPTLLQNGLAVLGATGIAWSVLIFDETVSYPSFRAILPAAGAAFIILAGLVYPKSNVVKILSLPILVYIGLVSYAWYLWHWPLLVFGKTYDASNAVPFRDYGVIAFSLLLAVLSYRFLERPLRSWANRRSIHGWRVVVAGLIGCLSFAAVGLAMTEKLAPSLEVRHADEIRRLNSGYQPPPGKTGSCYLISTSDIANCSEWIGEGRSGLLIGDSHAGALSLVTSYRTGSADAVLAIAVSEACIPLVGVVPKLLAGDPTDECWLQKSKLESWLVDPSFRPEFAILAAHWRVYAQTRLNFRPNPAVIVPMDSGADGRGEEDLFIYSMKKTINRLTEAGVKRIIIVGQIPTMPAGPACLLKAGIAGQNRDDLCALKQAQLEDQISPVMDWIVRAVAGLDDIRVIEPASALCDGKLCRPYSEDGYSLYSDDDHLNSLGAEKVWRHFSRELDWLINGN